MIKKTATDAQPCYQTAVETRRNGSSFAKGAVEQELAKNATSTSRRGANTYKIYRPTPLVRLRIGESARHTAKIYFKNESVSPGRVA